MAVFACADFIEHLAQPINVCLRCAWAFRWDEPFGAHERVRDIGSRDQPDVGKFWNAIDEDDVRRLHVPMHQAVLVQIVEGRSQRQPDLQGFPRRQPSPPGHLALQRSRNVRSGVVE